MKFKVENAHKTFYWNKPITRSVHTGWLTPIVVVVLAVILAGLTSLNPLLGITSALVFFLMVLVMSRPLLIVYGLTLILPLVGGLSRGAVIPFLRLGQALLVLGFILFLLARPSPLGKSRLSTIDLTFALFFLAEAVFPLAALYFRGEHFNLNQVDSYGGTTLQILLGPIQYYLLYRIVVATITSEKQIAIVVKLSFMVSIVVSIIGILERFVAPVRNFIETYYPPSVQTPDVSINDLRITSTLGHFSGLGAYLAFTIILALACYTVGQRMKISALLLALTTLFDSIALLLTGTLAVWIGLAIGVVALCILIRRVPGLFIFILFGIVLAALIFQSFLSSRLNQQLGAGAAQGIVPQSLAFRIQLWEVYFIPAIGQHLIFGAGPSPAVLYYWPTEESQYLLLLLRGGLSFLLSYLLLIGAAMGICWRQIKSKSRDASYPVAVALLVILIAISFMNVTGEYFTYVGGTQVLWTLLALVVASRQFNTLSSPAIEPVRDKPLYKQSNQIVVATNEPAQSLPTSKAISFTPRPYQHTHSRMGSTPWEDSPERPWGMIRLRRIISNTIISFLGQVITWTSTLLLTIAYGRYLGASTFGELFFAITFVSLVGIPVDFGYANQIVRDVSQKPDIALRYFSNILIIKLITWSLMYVVILLLAWRLGYNRDVRMLVAICGIDLLWNTLASTFASLHYAFERTFYPVVGGILEKGLSAFVGIMILKSGGGVQIMALVLVGGSFINTIWQAAWFFRQVGIGFVIDSKLMLTILRANIPFLIFGILMMSYSRIDTVLLSLMTNNTVVGWYGAATRIFDTMNFLPSIVISTIMYPIFSKLSTTSDTDLKLAVEKSINFLLFCVIPIATVLIIAAPNIVGFLYGQSGFSQAIPALQALAPGVILVYINYAFITMLLSKKKDKKIPIMAGIALIFNLGINLILIPLYRQTGAAIVTSLTELLIFFISIIITPRNLRPSGSLRVAFKALIASLVMALVILPLHTLHIFVILPVAMLVYLGIALLLGTIPKEDYQAIYRAIRHKAHLDTDLSSDEPQETPLPFYDADALLEDGLATTMKLPTIQPRKRQQFDNEADTLLEDGLAATVRLPNIRRQQIRQDRQIPETFQVPPGEKHAGENISNNEV